MAVRSIAQLKAWFKRGLYPVAAQFADWMDSYWHKEEQIPISSIENLSTQLNDKYAKTDGEELERKHNQLSADFALHEEENTNEFLGVYDNIKKLKAEDVLIWADIATIHQDVTDLQAVDVELRAEVVKLHDKDTELQTSLTNAHTDLGTIREMMKAGATLAEAKAALLALGANYKDLYAVAGTLKAFLEANDTADTTINTWTEIEKFLQGITDSQSLTALLNALETKITTAYNVAIAAAVKVETDRAEAAELAVSKKVDREQARAEAAEAALGGRITDTKNELKQTDTEIKQDIAAVRQTVFAIQAESAGRVIPLIVNIAPPKKITLGNPVTQFIKVELLPSYAVQNVLFLGDGKAVDVEPDGAVRVLSLGESRVHIIPPENTALHKTITVEVVKPSIIKASAGAMLLTGNGKVFLT